MTKKTLQEVYKSNYKKKVDDDIKKQSKLINKFFSKQFLTHLCLNVPFTSTEIESVNETSLILDRKKNKTSVLILSIVLIICYSLALTLSDLSAAKNLWGFHLLFGILFFGNIITHFIHSPIIKIDTHKITYNNTLNGTKEHYWRHIVFGYYSFHHNRHNTSSTLLVLIDINGNKKNIDVSHLNGNERRSLGLRTQFHIDKK